MHGVLALCTLAVCPLYTAAGEGPPELKVVRATRAETPPRIDGVLDDDLWRSAQRFSDFVQHTPREGAQPGQRTEVMLAYDDKAIYVGAMLYDAAPDSIMAELGERDDWWLNADMFRFKIDPYNTRQDAWDFGVYASGVQVDTRFSDGTYNAVWESAARIGETGWAVEMRIPYSAIRFPNTDEQTWSVQFTRTIRRSEEFIQWALTPRSESIGQNFWGTVSGIRGIRTPVRLSVSPYVSSYVERVPVTAGDGSISSATVFSYNAGTDLKYGLDDRFTLDVTLLPDFGQVQSDAKVKNLSYNEVTYAENRPFFAEGVELFSRDQLFYSRRIGQTPSGFYSVAPGPGETVTENPQQARLVNATKISGRNNSGLGMGFFNAVTNDTYATIRDEEGRTRSELTEPLTNYNAIVIDKQYRNNAGFYLINTNVIRSGSHTDANVTGGGMKLYTRKKDFLWFTSGAYSSRFLTGTEGRTASTGYRHYASLSKVSGSVRYGASYNAMSPDYDSRDMGYYVFGNYRSVGANLDYRLLKPTDRFRYAFAGIGSYYSVNYETSRRSSFRIGVNGNVQLSNLWGAWTGISLFPLEHYDYFEPRVDGRYYARPPVYWGYGGVRSDDRRKLTVEAGGSYAGFMSAYKGKKRHGAGMDLAPMLRVNKRLSFEYRYNYFIDHYNVGFAGFLGTDTVVFGGRAVETITNSLTGRYVFTRDMAARIKVRHYWSTGKYKDHYILLGDGSLSAMDAPAGRYDFSFNAFTVDLVFTWWFAPGSTLSVVYKNAIETDGGAIAGEWRENFEGTIRSPQTNSLSVKALYYLDYLYLRSKRS